MEHLAKVVKSKKQQVLQCSFVGANCSGESKHKARLNQA